MRVTIGVLVAAATIVIATPSEARIRHTGHGMAVQPWGHVWIDGQPARRIKKRHRKAAHALNRRGRVKVAHRARHATHGHRAQIVAHPAGCPARAFCGCGVAKYVFGKPIRSLYLAANWLKFPAAKPAPGMVAARRGHVFAIIKPLGDGKVLAYDPNSGRRQTRIHVRSLAGFRVVNPRG